MNQKWDLEKHKKASSQISLAIFLCILSLILGALIGYLISNYFFNKNIDYLEFKELKEINELRPNVTIESYDENYFAIIIKTGNNKEIINKLIISFIIDGKATKKYPRVNIINGEPCSIENKPFSSFNDQVIYEKIIIKCENVLPTALNGAIVEYEKSNVQIGFDDRIFIEWYWTYKGQTKKEMRWQNR